MTLLRAAWLACVVGVCVRAGPMVLQGADSGCYARVASEWASRPLGLGLTLGGERFIEHPPLALWLEGVVFRVFGASVEVAVVLARLWALLTLLIVVRIVQRIADDRTAGWSLIAALALPAFQFTSQVPMLEAPLTAMVALGVLGLVTETGWMFVVGVVAGVWVKGPPALVLFGVVGVAVVLRWVSVKWAVRAALVAGAATTLSVLAFSHFWSDYLHHQLVPSALEGRHHPDSNPLFFARPLLNWYAPALVALVLAIVTRNHPRFPRKLALLGAVLWGGVVMGFTLPVQKYDWYIYPGVVGAVLVLGAVLSLVPERFDATLVKAIVVGAGAWVLGCVLVGDRALTALQRQQVAMLKAPPAEPRVVADCSTLGPWMSEHLMAFVWKARRVGCDEPASWRFDGAVLSRTDQP